MTAWIITGSIVLLLLAVLLVPIRLCFAYGRGGLSLSLHFLFVRLRILPTKEKKPPSAKKQQRMDAKAAEKKTKKEAKKAAKAEKEPPPSEKAKQSTGDFLEMLWEFAKTSHRALSILRRHLVVYKLQAVVLVGGADAFETAMKFSRISTICYTAMCLLDELVILQPPQISISPQFLSEETTAEVSVRVRISLLFLLWAAIVAAARLFTILRNSRGGKTKHRAAAKINNAAAAGDLTQKKQKVV